MAYQSAKSWKRRCSMLVLDRNNEPTSTVYYLAAAAYYYIAINDGVGAFDLYEQIVQELVCRKVNYEFYLMALDFLFLLDRLTVDGRGGLHVHRIVENS